MIVEFLKRGEVPLAPVTGKDTVDDFPLRLVLELVLSPTIKIATVEKLDPTVSGSMRI